MKKIYMFRRVREKEKQKKESLKKEKLEDLLNKFRF